MAEGKRPSGVIFDLGGVLLDFDHMEICRGLADICGRSSKRVYEEVFASGLEARYDKGMATLEFHAELLKTLGLKDEDLPIEELSLIWSDIFSEKADVVELARGLKGRTGLYLLSNTNEMHYGFVSSRFPFIEEIFDDVFLSFKLGMTKPDVRVFNRVIRETGLDAGELFYIDDRDEHVEAARSAGIHSTLFTGADSLSVTLASLGF